MEKSGISANNDDITVDISVKGLVQGVGFRPFIYRIAVKNNIKGWVENRNDCVQIKAQGKKSDIDLFSRAIEEQAPEAANIFSIKVSVSSPGQYTDFIIAESKSTSEKITEISPDIAVCSECLHDMKTQEHRIGYPFINCTNCGPRFSIIKDLPYDRDKTTMKEFVMCNKCEKEYEDITDRRFHAQPVACSLCGPHYELALGDKRINDLNDILEEVARLIQQGKIIAVKGIGGFHIMCSAVDEEAVKRLRNLKHREGKPFAVMFSGSGSLKEYADVSDKEEEILKTWRRPIVLLKAKKELAESVCVGFDTIGAMLPYMPFHYLLFEKPDTPAVVLTSGNLSDEPIVVGNAQAIRRLSQISDAVLTYNRDIYNRTDDSVVFVVNNTERVIRRSRGYAPSPVRVTLDVEGIIAAGAELVNCFCIGKENQAIMSQHIGDLKNLETLDFYSETIDQYKKLFRFDPVLFVHDKHPDYLSTKYALESGIPVTSVQHHHAHIASCMAEYGLDETVIGVSLDGTGYGDDGNIWGGEFLVCDLADHTRYSHFEYIPMPGGDRAVEEPWRMAVAYLYNIYKNEIFLLDNHIVDIAGNDKLKLIIQAIEKNINCPLTSSAGRLFDAVAAITGVCTVSKFHAEAPMRLESVIDRNIKERYDCETGREISFGKTIRGVVDDLRKGVPVPVISAKFHNTVISAIFDVVSEIRTNKDINKIVLSGGVFQNRYLLKGTEDALHNGGFDVYSHSAIPTNDGGIALGQIMIAAKRRQIR